MLKMKQRKKIQKYFYTVAAGKWFFTSVGILMFFKITMFHIEKRNKVNFLKNNFTQLEQENCFSPVWELSCFFRSPFSLNVW